ncbi:MAG: SGNH/GDSL hydrolase family protein [Planctomycetota bacterium]|jgi:hypothetical protein
MGSAGTPLWRKLLLSLSVLVGLPLLAEGGAQAWLALRNPPEVPPPSLTEQVHCAYDEQLGWRNMPDAHRPDIYGPGRSLTNNARGFRSLEEHTQQVPAGRTRVVCLGDSFTMGYGVDDADTYPAAMQRLCPDVQTVNMGLGAYGLGQATLWYLSDGTELETDVLLFAVIDADFNRMMMDAFGGFPKPRVDVVDGELVVRNVPVPRAFRSTAPPAPGWDAFVSGLALVQLSREPGPSAPPVPYVAPTEERWEHTLRVAAGIFDALAGLSAERGQQFVLVYIPTGRLAGNGPSPTALWLRDYSAESGTPLIDLGPPFFELPREEREPHFLPDFHLSEQGNAYVARLLLDELSQRIEGFPACDG